MNSEAYILIIWASLLTGVLGFIIRLAIKELMRMRADLNRIMQSQAIQESEIRHLDEKMSKTEKRLGWG